MTENKRFTLTFDDKIVDNLTGIIHEVHSGYDVAMDLSGLLNELNDENEQLKKDCTILIHHNQDYRKENEQLKADKQALIDFIRKEFPKSHKHILEGFE